MIYTYDGSYYGLLTCVYHHYYFEPAQEIYSQQRFVGSIIDEVIYVETNEEMAHKVESAIRDKFSVEGYLAMYRSFLSDDDKKDCYILKYLMKGFKLGPKIDRLYSESYVIKIRELSKRVGFEAHRFLGYLRFVEKGDYLYAELEPDNDILPLIADHFADRYLNEKIVIHDTKREKAMLASKGRWMIQDIEDGEAEQMSALPTSRSEELLQELWKSYHEHIAIEGRINPKLQQAFVPLKYRKHIIEFD